MSGFYNLSALVLGLAAWGFGLNAIRRGRGSFCSFTCCGLAMVMQFWELRRRCAVGDTSGILDTIDAVALAAAVLLAVTAGLNLAALWKHRR